MRPCAGPQGHTTWLGGWAAWFDGGFRGAEQARALAHLSRRRREGEAGDPAPRRSGAQATPAPVRTHCAHPLARRPRVLVARQHATSVPTSLLRGREEADGSRFGRLQTACSRRALERVERRVGVRAKAAEGQAHPRDAGGLGAVLGACRGVAGDVPGPWPCHWHARITQRPRVGELEPKAVFLGVGGQFHE